MSADLRTLFVHAAYELLKGIVSEGEAFSIAGDIADRLASPAVDEERKRDESFVTGGSILSKANDQFGRIYIAREVAGRLSDALQDCGKESVLTTLEQAQNGALMNIGNDELSLAVRKFGELVLCGVSRQVEKLALAA